MTPGFECYNTVTIELGDARPTSSSRQRQVLHRSPDLQPLITVRPTVVRCSPSDRRSARTGERTANSPE